MWCRAPTAIRELSFAEQPCEREEKQHPKTALSSSSRRLFVSFIHSSLFPLGLASLTMSFTRWMFAVLVALFFMIQLAAACGMSMLGGPRNPFELVLFVVVMPFTPAVRLAGGLAHSLRRTRRTRLVHNRSRLSGLHARANTPSVDEFAMLSYAMELVMLGDFHAAYPYLTELLYPTRQRAWSASRLEIRHQVAARYLRMMTNRSLQDPAEAALDAKAALDLLAQSQDNHGELPPRPANSLDWLADGSPKARKEIRITPRTLTVAYCNLLLDQVLHGPRSSEYPTSDDADATAPDAPSSTSNDDVVSLDASGFHETDELVISRSASEAVSARELLAEAARMLDDLGPILPTDTLDDRTELRLARCAITFYRCFYEPSLGPNATDGGAARTAALEEVLCITAEVIVDLDSAEVSGSATTTGAFNRLRLAQYRSQALGVRARSLALLRRYDEAEAAQEANLAIRVMGFDRKMRPLSEPVRINLRDDMQLAVPLRPPPDISGLRKSPHEFKAVTLLSPTWCETCTGFIVSLRAARCTKCNWTVHTECQSKAEKAKCWATPKATNTTSSSIEDSESDDDDLSVSVSDIDDDDDDHDGEGHDKTCGECQKLQKAVFSGNSGPVKKVRLPHREETLRQAPLDPSHHHTLKHVWFHKPTWCSRCGKFVCSPVGKQGYSCTTCRFTVHNKCAGQLYDDIFLDE